MPFSLTEDIKPISTLKKKTREIFQQLHRTGQPIVITVNGKPDAVLIDVEVFERKLKTLNLSVLLAEAQKDIEKKQVRPARNFLRELKRRAKVPG